MKTLTNPRFLLACAIMLVAGYALYASLHWPFRTALFPRVIGIPLLALALWETLLVLFGAEKQQEGYAVDFEMSKEVAPEVARRRTIAVFAWILGFLGLIILVGFPLAVPLFVFLYIKLAGKEGWVLTLLLTAVSWIFMEGLFDRFLHLPFKEGWIFTLWK